MREPRLKFTRYATDRRSWFISVDNPRNDKATWDHANYLFHDELFPDTFEGRYARLVSSLTGTMMIRFYSKRASNYFWRCFSGQMGRGYEMRKKIRRLAIQRRNDLLGNTR